MAGLGDRESTKTLSVEEEMEEEGNGGAPRGREEVSSFTAVRLFATATGRLA